MYEDDAIYQDNDDAYVPGRAKAWLCKVGDVVVECEACEKGH
jgi:hypothetical protein